MEFAFHTRLDGLDTCRALSRTSAGVARNARKARRGMLLCALLCAAYLAYYVYVAVRDEAPIFRDPLGVIFLLGLGYCIVCWAKVRGGNYAELAARARAQELPAGPRAGRALHGGGHLPFRAGHRDARFLHGADAAGGRGQPLRALHRPFHGCAVGQGEPHRGRCGRI